MSAGVEAPATAVTAPYTRTQRLTLLACILGSATAFLEHVLAAPLSDRELFAPQGTFFDE